MSIRVPASPLNSINQAAIAITGGTINGAVIGGTSQAAGTFTTLTALSTVTLSPVNNNVVLSPTGTGVVTINPATAGTINRCSIGATTPAAGTFTAMTVNADNATAFTNQTDGAGAGVGTLTNAPASTNPTFWLRVTVNGANKFIPCW